MLKKNTFRFAVVILSVVFIVLIFCLYNLCRLRFESDGQLQEKINAEMDATIEVTSQVTASMMPVQPQENSENHPAMRDKPYVSANNKLQNIVDSFVEGSSEEWSIYILGLESGVSAQHDCGSVVSASIIKLFIMGSVYKKIDCGELERDEVADDLYSMITISDNDSANRLTLLLGNGSADNGFRYVNKFAEELSCIDTKMSRLMLDNNGLQNYTSAQDCAILFEAIYRGNCISQEASDFMMHLLLQQTVNNRIPEGIPETARCAHKTGDLIGESCGDAGIVFSEGEDYIICVICNKPEDDYAVSLSIVELSDLVYSYFN